MIASKSLRWQLQSYYALLLFLALGTLTALAIHWMRESERHQYDSRLRELQHILMPILRAKAPEDSEQWKLFSPISSNERSQFSDRSRGGPGGPDRGPRRGGPGGRPPSDGPQGPKGGPGGNPARRKEALDELLNEGWYFGLVSFEGEPIRQSRNFPEDITLSFDTSSKEGDIIVDDNGYRHLVHREPGRVISIIGYPKSQLAAYMQKRQWIIIGISSALFAIATLLGRLLIQRALRPINDIRTAANKIAEGELSARIDEDAQNKNEIKILSENLNETFSKLETMFERQKRFTSDASHELRTPIAVILGYCQVALEKGRSPEQIREAVQACRRAGERMKNLTNDLLELSRIESGEISFEFASCSVRDFAEEALELVEPLAAEKNITLREDLEDAKFNGNSDRLWQVLVNLLNNAIRHTPPGNAITLKCRSEGGDLKIEVIDEGEGIPKQDLPHIFDRFYRADLSRTRQNGGSGLGLSISETIVKAHGGTIQVQSEIGTGSTFTISLPLAG